MYKAAYMFYFAPNAAAKQITEIPKKCLSCGGVWWKCGNLHIMAQSSASSVEVGLYSTLKEILKNCNPLQIYTMSAFRGGVSKSRWRITNPRISALSGGFRNRYLTIGRKN